MDLGACINVDPLEGYVKKHYGVPPRLRGIRLMAVEEPIKDAWGQNEETFNKYVGQDVVYIHTRCGGDNYEYFEADKWENGTDLFICGVDDTWDCTYRDHYFKAVVDEEYKRLLKEAAYE